MSTSSSLELSMEQLKVLSILVRVSAENYKKYGVFHVTTAEIQNHLGVSWNNTKYHLKNLVDKGLIEQSEMNGRATYSLSPEGLSYLKIRHPQLIKEIRSYLLEQQQQPQQPQQQEPPSRNLQQVFSETTHVTTTRRRPPTVSHIRDGSPTSSSTTVESSLRLATYEDLMSIFFQAITDLRDIDDDINTLARHLTPRMGGFSTRTTRGGIDADVRRILKLLAASGKLHVRRDT